MTRKSKGKQKASNSSANRSMHTRTPTASSSKPVTIWDETRASRWTPEAIDKKLKEREERFEARRQGIDALKHDGNKHFQAGSYEAALSTYTYILKLYGANPTIFSNLAATLLKLENYQYADSMALEALKRDPANLKARFRRAMARKGLKRYIAALSDLSTIISADPTMEEARREQSAVTRLIDESTEDGKPYVDSDEGIDGLFDSMDPEFPPFDQPPLVFEEEDVDSDSEDAKHEGNGIACKYYNRGTCIDGEKCDYSHAPDDKSQRDKLGRNVCNYYLLGNCIFGEKKCYYLHDKTYLGDGWWNDEAVVAEGPSLFEPGFEPHHLGTELGAFMAGFSRRVRRASGIDSFPDGQRFEYSEKKHREAQKMKGVAGRSTLDQRYIMVLALEQELEYDYQQPTLAALKSKLPVKIVQSSADALFHLASPDLAGVFATDDAISTPRQSKLLAKVIEYVKAGGRFVLGGGFSTFVKPSHVAPLFRKFGYQWGKGDYHRTTFALNKSSLLIKDNLSLNVSYSMKAVHLTGVGPEHAIYLPTRESPVANKADPPAAYAPVEKGFLGYIGDVNWEQGSVALLLAMLDLLDTLFKPDGPLRDLANAKEASSTSPTTPCSSHKQSSPDFILLISLSACKNFAVKYQRMLSALGQKINYVQVFDASKALKKMDSPHLKGVFVTDDTLTKRVHGDLASRLVRYVNDGGNIVFGAEIGYGNGDLTSAFLLDAWDILWDVRNLDRITAVLNVKHGLAKSHKTLPKAFTMKTAQVFDITTKEILFISYSTLDDMIESHGSDSEDGWVDDDDSDSDSSLLRHDLEAPIVSTKAGRGNVTFVGDVNIEEGTVEVLLAILCPTEQPLSNAAHANSTSSSSLPPSKPPAKSFIMVLSFDHAKEFVREHSRVLDTLEEADWEVVHGLSVQRTLELMKSLELLAIFIPYADIVKPEHAYLVSKLVEFTEAGGNVVIGGEFASSIHPDEVGPFFRNWGLQWEAQGDTPVPTNTILNAKSAFAGVHRPPDIPQTWEMSALQISGFSKKDQAIYVAPDEISRIKQTPVIITKVGYGNLGYIGEAGFSNQHVWMAIEMLRMP